jgi:hypothetical protein
MIGHRFARRKSVAVMLAAVVLASISTYTVLALSQRRHQHRLEYSPTAHRAPPLNSARLPRHPPAWYPEACFNDDDVLEFQSFAFGTPRRIWLRRMCCERHKHARARSLSATLLGHYYHREGVAGGPSVGPGPQIRLSL